MHHYLFRELSQRMSLSRKMNTGRHSSDESITNCRGRGATGKRANNFISRSLRKVFLAATFRRSWRLWL